ncbi:MAG: hypothetical protein KDD37_00625 [Bdellovibrionales bacterium]|nr:hypothetical protein [Bdellovibrionales bacterium]
MKLWQWILSVVILFHLLVVIIIPNQQSYFQYAWRSVLMPYAGTLNIAFAWQFFSPDPAAAIYYDYSAIADDEIKYTLTYPDDVNRPWFRPNYSRRNTLKNVFMKFPYLNEKIFIPYFCKTHPDIDIFDVSKRVVRPTTFDEAFEGRALTDESQVIKQDLGMFGCKNF